jgi:hypothetical protein
MPLPRLFSQFFEHTDDHRSHRRLQPLLDIASGSEHRYRSSIRDHRHLLNAVRYFIAVAARRNLAAVKHQYHLAGKAPRR